MGGGAVMAKYRKLPVVIEAFQMTSGAMESPFLWPNWLTEAWGKGLAEPGRLFRDTTGNFYLYTLENKAGREHCVDRNDWIIQGIQGELYPCKPDIFAATYELAGA